MVVNTFFIKNLVKSSFIRCYLTSFSKFYSRNFASVKIPTLHPDGHLHNLELPQSKSIETKIENINNDALLYENNNTRYFRYMKIFGFVQFISFLYFAHYLFFDSNVSHTQEKKEDKKSGDKKEKKPFSLPMWKVLDEEGFSRYANYTTLFSVFSGLTGLCALGVTALYTKSNIKNIILKKGGKQVAVEFFTLLFKRDLKIMPLDHVSARNSRHNAVAYITLKLKDRKVSALIDMHGKFLNPELFDRSVGVKRSWK